MDEQSNILQVVNFHLEIRSIRDTNLLLIEWVAGPNHVRVSSNADSPLKKTYKDEQDLGYTLYQILFNRDEVRNSFEACRQMYCAKKSPDKVNRVQLRLILEIVSNKDTPEPLFSLPWELLYDGRRWLARDPCLSIVRRMNVRKTSSRPTRHHLGLLPLSLAFSEPKDKLPESNEGEKTPVADAYRKIRSVLSQFSRFQVEEFEHTTKDAFEGAIKNSNSGIVHFIGHGDVEQEKAKLGLLFLELERGATSDILTATELKRWLSDAEYPPILLVFTACHSGKPTEYGFLGVASALLDAGVEAVVAMQMELYNDEAEQFSEAFYRSLNDGFLIDDAVQAGRRVLEKYKPRTLDRAPAGSLILGERNGHHLVVTVRNKDGTVSSYALGQNIRNVVVVNLPGWAAPVLFLNSDGWLAQGSPEPSITWDTDGKEMVYIPEGNFYIDKFPVTRAEYREFASRTGRLVPVSWNAADEEKIVQRVKTSVELPNDCDDSFIRDNLPATDITIVEAKAYAAWAGKQIPTPEEWQQAALSGCENKNQSYPWGSEFLSGRSNTFERGIATLWPVRLSSHVKGCNPASMCDIVGNAAEWVSKEEGFNFVCGGSFNEFGSRCTIQRTRPIKNLRYRNAAVGFRCLAKSSDLRNFYKRQKE